MNNYKTATAVLAVLFSVSALAVAFFAASPGMMSHSVATTTTVTTTVSTTIVSSNTVTVSHANTLNIAYNPSIGYYLTNSAGFTLYIFKADKPGNGTSACYGDCAKAWPAFYTSNLVLPPGVASSAFGSIKRTDGKMQLTCNGQPLYYFASDTNAGDTKGQGFGNVWFAGKLPAPAASGGS